MDGWRGRRGRDAGLACSADCAGGGAVPVARREREGGRHRQSEHSRGKRIRHMVAP